MRLPPRGECRHSVVSAIGQKPHQNEGFLLGHFQNSINSPASAIRGIEHGWSLSVLWDPTAANKSPSRVQAVCDVDAAKEPCFRMLSVSCSAEFLQW